MFQLHPDEMQYGIFLVQAKHLRLFRQHTYNRLHFRVHTSLLFGFLANYRSLDISCLGCGTVAVAMDMEVGRGLCELIHVSLN
jgi:hypothetical protein